jgi:hypothetical protein
MSQAGYTPIQLYFSTTAAAVPVNTNLANGELAINITDEKLYFKNAAGVVKLLASNATSAPVLSFSAGTTGFTPNTATTGAVTLAGTLATTNGGTGLTSFTSGGVVYASSSSALATGSALTFDGTNLGIGSTSPVSPLTINGNDPLITLKNAGTNRWQFGFENTSSNRFVFYDNTATAYRLIIDSSGNVSIGTTSANSKLTVNSGATTFVSSLASTGTNTYTPTVSTSLVNSTLQLFGGSASGSTTGIRMSQGGAFEAFFGGVQEAGGAAAFVFQGYNGTAYAERLRIASLGQIGLSGANYGSSGQVLTSGGSGAAPTWTTAGGGSAATPTALGTVYGKTDSGSPFTTSLGYQAGNSTTGTYNVTVGYQAGLSNVTGIKMTAVGHGALYSSTVSHNTAVGSQSLSANTTGQYNAAVGSEDAAGWPTLYTNTTGSYNIAIGAGVLKSNTTGSNSTVVGYQAGFSNTTGILTAFGYRAGYSQTTNAIYLNTFIGYEAGYNTTGAGHTCVGHNAGKAMAGGNWCTAVGYNALAANTVSGNGAFGVSALQSNTTGTDNNAFGYAALSGNTTGSSNVAFGHLALNANTTASGNVAVGYRAGRLITTGVNNTLLGTDAGGQLTTGVRNTFIGGSNGSTGPAGYQVTTGSSNTILGNYDGNQDGLDIRTASNYIVLSDGDGRPRVVGESTGVTINGIGNPNANGTPTINRMYIGTAGWNAEMLGENNYWNVYVSGTYFNLRYRGSGSGSIVVNNGSVNFNTSSDYRLKENIAPMTGALAKVALLKPCTYTWKATGEAAEGFIAHELQEVIPTAVTGKKDALDEDGRIKPQGVDTSFLVATLTAAIQEQQAIIESLKARLDAANL